MADFEQAFRKTMNFEGGYSNDPDDPGGETYKGIARRFHNAWPGWVAIDDAKTMPDFPASLKHVRLLQELVFMFYKRKFWSSILLDDMDSQKVANEMFDTGVNMGQDDAVRFAQEALNVLDGADLREDGRMGPKTLDAINSYTANRINEKVFVITLDGFQFMHYLNLARMNPKMKKFLRGWLNHRIRNEET